ncbi:MAG: acyl carrier protein [Hyphomonadaceae bacterium]|nr:acyl carrier protein [Hyphomonadaceae bacterium]
MPDETALRAWIRAALAQALSMPPEAIDDEQTFDAYGLPSLEAVMLTGDLEDWLGRPVDAEAALAHASVAALARHLATPPPAAGATAS